MLTAQLQRDAIRVSLVRQLEALHEGRAGSPYVDASMPEAAILDGEFNLNHIARAVVEDLQALELRMRRARRVDRVSRKRQRIAQLLEILETPR